MQLVRQITNGLGEGRRVLLQGDQCLPRLALAVGGGNGPFHVAQHDRQSGELLTQVVVQVTRDAGALQFLRVDQPAGKVLVLFRNHPVARLALAQGGFDPAPPDALHHEAGDEGRLKQDDASRGNDVVLVLRPYACLPVPDSAARGHVRFVDAPVLQGPPIKHRHWCAHQGDAEPKDSRKLSAASCLASLSTLMTIPPTAPGSDELTVPTNTDGAA